MPDPLLGQSLGRYKIEHLIGEGGMARVYLARRADGQPAALKVLRDEHSRNETMVQRFMQEANAMAQLQHPHITPVFDAARDKGRYYMAMAYMAGRDLRTRLNAQYQSAGYGLTMAEALSAAIQAAAGLEYAHQRGLAHRDVKLNNFLLTERGEVKLADFGIALALALPQPAGVVGGITGTPAYIAPEQIANPDQADHRADIYALGVVLYELLAGRLPFSGDTDLSLLHQQIYETPLPLARLNSTVPDNIRKIVEKAMAKDPAKRYQRITLMQADLERALFTLPPQKAALRPPINGQGQPQGVQLPTLVSRPVNLPPQTPRPTGRANYNLIIILSGLLVAAGSLWFLLKDVIGSPPGGLVSPSITPTLTTASVSADITPTPTVELPTPTDAPLTATAMPTRPPTPTLTAAPTLETPRPAASTPTTDPGLTTAPVLVAPSPGETIYAGRSGEFKWKWPGQLPPNASFLVYIWPVNSNQTDRGAYNVQEMADQIQSLGDGVYGVSFDPASAAPNRDLTDYEWSVAVVQVNPYQQLGPPAASHRLVIGHINP